jgi:hypothetical protein
MVTRVIAVTGELETVQDAPPLVVSSMTGPGELPDACPSTKQVDASGQEIPDAEATPASRVGADHAPPDILVKAAPSLAFPVAKQFVVNGHAIPTVDNPSYCVAHELTLRAFATPGL